MFRKISTISGLIGFAILAFVVGLIVSSHLNITPWGNSSDIWMDGKGASTSVSGSAPDFVKMARDLNPTVVNIFTTKIIKRPKMAPPMKQFGQRDPFEEFFGPQWFERFLGPQFPIEQKSLGSGFIINKAGYILTNNHVVEGADEIKVKLADKREFGAKVIGKDPKTDIALIKINSEGDLPVAVLGDSDKIEIGEWVMAIGNPFGFGHTVTKGIISAKARVIGMGPYDNFIQTDAPINQGNSGGPLFNGKEEVIGISAAIALPAQNIGFAIPINMAKEVLPQLKEKGKVTRGWLGVEIQAVTPELAEALDLKEAEGALVAKVLKDSPADKAGIKQHDVVVEFNGKKVGESHDLPSIVAMTHVGSDAEVKLIREGKPVTLHVKIAELPEGEAPEAGEVEEEKGEAFGLSLRDVTPEIAQQFNLKEGEGVIVAGVEPGSTASEAGIRPGDLIIEVNRKKVRNLKDYRLALEKTPSGKPVLFLIQRGESRIFVAIKP